MVEAERTAATACVKRRLAESSQTRPVSSRVAFLLCHYKSGRGVETLADKVHMEVMPCTEPFGAAPI